MLNEHHVEYLLLGGYAVAFHGFIRATGVMDIWVRPTEENGVRVLAALKEFGFNTDEVDPKAFGDDKYLLRMGHPPFRLEIMTSAYGVVFDECYRNRIVEMINGIEVNVISKRDLMSNKKASGRLKDLADVDNLP